VSPISGDGSSRERKRLSGGNGAKTMMELEAETARRHQSTCSSASAVIPKREPIQWIVAKRHFVARKVIVSSLEMLDAIDCPDNPGLLYESTIIAMVQRFDAVFGTRQGPLARGEQVTGVLEHLRRHTRRRRGQAVLREGYLEWEQTSRIYDLFVTDLNFCEQIFFTVDVGESSAVLSKLCSFFLIFMIIISIFTWMVSTLPMVQDIKTSCTSIEVGECPPEPFAAFKLIESVCVITFTVEYLVRLLTVHSVRFALLNEYFMEAVLTGCSEKEVKEKRSEGHHDDERPPARIVTAGGPQKLDGKMKTLLVHLAAFSNVIDLLAILPFWLETCKLQGGGGFLVVLRILRLTRVFRVFKLGKYNDVFTLFKRVIAQSMPALLLMMFFIALGCCLFGTLMWFAEQGTWYPQRNSKLAELGVVGRGAWLRHTGSMDADDLEESPFYSIIHSFWYVVVTITTVGYGDVGPTSGAGKVIAAVAILKGIIVLAMPIGVVGTNFGSEYYRTVEERKRRQRLKIQLETRAALEQQEDAAVQDEARGELLEDSSLDEAATELQRIDVARKRIIGEAELLDKQWHHVLPEVLHGKLAESLKAFVVSFVGAAATATTSPSHGPSPQSAPEVTGFASKPKIQMSRLEELDALTIHVSKAISSIQSADDLSEFGLKESFECRKKWLLFVDQCWEYAANMCTVDKHQAAPDFFQMKTRLASSRASDCPRPRVPSD